MDAISLLIDELGRQSGNGGPLLDEHDEALAALGNLHASLGGLITAIDRGVLNDDMGESYAADIARYGQRVVNALSFDPARYTIGLTVFALLSLCGLADLGGFVGGAALGIPKRQKLKRSNKA